MSEINPARVTKPMQLLAAWLAGLIAIDTAFLVAASRLEVHSSGQLILILAAVTNVPLFLGALFLLQTRFRPELQEDTFYSRYLDTKTNQLITVARDDKAELEIYSLKQQLAVLTSNVNAVTAATSAPAEQAEPIGHTSARRDTALGRQWTIAINDHLSNFQQIRDEFRQQGIAVADVFGSATTDEKPEHAVVTMRRELDFDSKREFLRIAHSVNMQAYNYFDPNEPEPIYEAILIGSYGYASRPVFRITPKLIELFDRGGDSIDLKFYERNHQVNLTD
jgi:hypothetical protein